MSTTGRDDLTGMPPDAAAQALSWLRDALLPGADLRTDSRAVCPGDGFLAYAVQGADNRPHIGDAVARGARAVLVQPHGPAVPTALLQVPYLPVAGLDVLAGEIASGWYAQPSAQMSMLAVTGTNGKTTVTQWLAQALGNLRIQTALIGTLGAGLPDHLVPNGFTTPNTAQLQQLLASLLQQGAAAVAMEVSSHALHQGRVNGTRFDVAVLTNLTQDHLDYHRTMEAYEAAKARLFDWPGLRAAVVNREDAAGVRLLAHLAACRPDIITIAYGIDVPPVKADGVELIVAHHHLFATNVRANAQGGMHFMLHARHGIATLDNGPAPQPRAIDVAALGTFNVLNLLAVAGAVLSLLHLRDADAAAIDMAAVDTAAVDTAAIDMAAVDTAAVDSAAAGTGSATDVLTSKHYSRVVSSLSHLQPVRGRMQCLGGRANHDEPLVVIDYAHTPDALEKTLLALRQVADARHGELILAFGCGGDRDSAKRPLMGAIAARLADYIVLTSDNPRTEAPGAIIAEIARGVTQYQSGAATAGHPVRCIEDRASAILQAVRSARREDVVLLAGKGHEATQEMMGKKRPFSDQDHAQLALAARAIS